MKFNTITCFVLLLTETLIDVNGDDPVDNSTFSILQTSDQQFKMCQLVAISMKELITTAACAQSLVIDSSSYSIEVTPVLPVVEGVTPWAVERGES